jgi:hypothetical protein
MSFSLNAGVGGAGTQLFIAPSFSIYPVNCASKNAGSLLLVALFCWGWHVHAFGLSR